jgi:hypothetical protein
MKAAANAPATPSSRENKSDGLFEPGARNRAMIPAAKPMITIQRIVTLPSM